jgi:diacylglycerol kinase (ATP)
MASDTKGLRRLWNACGYSWAGLCAAWRYEEAFRQEIMLVGALVPVAIWLARSPLELVLLLGSGLLVLIVELLNSAIEAVTDRVGLERHVLSARAKDLGSAAVMLSLILMGIVWSGVLWQRFSQD